MRKIGEQSHAILKAYADHVRILVDKMEEAKGEKEVKVLKEPTGPGKRTRASTRKIETKDDKELKELKKSADHMQIMVVQAGDLMKSI